MGHSPLHHIIHKHVEGAFHPNIRSEIKMLSNIAIVSISEGWHYLQVGLHAADPNPLSLVFQTICTQLVDDLLKSYLTNLALRILWEICIEDPAEDKKYSVLSPCPKSQLSHPK